MISAGKADHLSQLLQHVRHDAKESLDAATSPSGLTGAAISQAVLEQRRVHLVSLLGQRFAKVAAEWSTAERSVAWLVRSFVQLRVLPNGPALDTRTQMLPRHAPANAFYTARAFTLD
jgi:hypothetical protein